MSTFDEEMAETHSAVEEEFGDLVKIIRPDTGARLEGVHLVFNRGVEVDLGDDLSRGTTIEYRKSVVGDLQEDDMVIVLKTVDGVVRETREKYALNRVLADDGDLVLRIATPAE